MSEPEIPIVEGNLTCPECDSGNLEGRGPRHDAILGEYMVWRCLKCDCEFRVFEFNPDAGTLREKRKNRRWWWRPGGRRR